MQRGNGHTPYTPVPLILKRIELLRSNKISSASFWISGRSALKQKRLSRCRGRLGVKNAFRAVEGVFFCPFGLLLQGKPHRAKNESSMNHFLHHYQNAF